jgi:hypothetical protein
VATHAQIEATKTVAGETITTTLENDCLWLVILHDGLDDRLEDRVVCGVIDAIAQGEVDGIVLAVANADIAELAGAREVFAILMERHCHDTIGRVEGLLDAIAVVDIDVDVKNALLEAQKLENGKYDVCKSALIKPD